MTSRRIAIAGGIGSGKSMVCRILSCMGYHIYDCDSRAASIMAGSAAIRQAICDEIDPQCVAGGIIDRKALGTIVFNNPAALQTLNRIVHSAVREDLSSWFGLNGDTMPDVPLFVETAILYQSGIDSMVDEVWEVTAPTEVRLRRVMQRNALTEAQVLARIQSQDGFTPGKRHPRVHAIVNDGVTPLLPRIESLLL